jgi:hypothetical protein
VTGKARATASTLDKTCGSTKGPQRTLCRLRCLAFAIVTGRTDKRPRSCSNAVRTSWTALASTSSCLVLVVSRLTGFLVARVGTSWTSMATYAFVRCHLAFEGCCCICVVTETCHEALGCRAETKCVGVGPDGTCLGERALERGRATIVSHWASHWAGSPSSTPLTHGAELKSILGLCEALGEAVVTSSTLKARARLGWRVSANWTDRHGRHTLLWARVSCGARAAGQVRRYPQSCCVALVSHLSGGSRHVTPDWATLRSDSPALAEVAGRTSGALRCQCEAKSIGVILCLPIGA